MALNYRAAVRATLRGVAAFDAELSRKLFGVIALGVDALFDWMKLGAKASWLRTKGSPNDALPLVGEERNIRRAPAETNAQYRARLLDAWTLWQQAGQHGGGDENSFAANALDPFGVPAANISVHYQADPDWAGDENEDNWSRFWILISDFTPWALRLVDGTWNVGSASTIGTTATPADVSAVRQFLRHFKAAWEIGVAVVLTDSDQVIGGFEVGDGTMLGNRYVRWELGRFLGDQYVFTVVGGDHHLLLGQQAKVGAIL